MKIRLLKQFHIVYVINIICISHFSYAKFDGPHNNVNHDSPPVITFKNKHEHKQKPSLHYGIRTTIETPIPQYDYTINYRALYGHLLPADFKQIFQYAHEHEVLSNYPLYILPHFLTFARTLPSYEQYILSLHDKITHDKNFKKHTAHVPGFYYSFFLWYEKSGFHNFIAAESTNILNAQKCRTSPIAQQQQKSITSVTQQQLHIHDRAKLTAIIHNYNARLQHVHNKDIATRLTERIKAINAVLNNPQSNLLDCQLHKELLETHTTLTQFEESFPNNAHMQLIAPAIHEIAAQAKIEHCPITAFELSDVCHAITQILCKGTGILYDTSHAIGTGIWKGAQGFASLEHWKNMATAPLEIGLQAGLLLVQAYGREDELNHAMISDLFSDSQKIQELEKKYSAEGLAHIDAISASVQETYNKIKSMSWQQVLENSTEIGTTIILDILALNALADVAHFKNNIFTKNLIKATESGTIFGEEFSVEVAGVGKLIVEDGAEFTTQTVHAMQSKNPLPKNKPNSNPSTKSTSPQSTPKTTSIPDTNVGKGIIRNVKEDLRSIIKKYEPHIFSKKHEKDGIMALGKDKETIMNSLYDIIMTLDKKGLLQEGPNQIKATINNISNVEIKCFIQKGEALSVDAYISDFNRIYGNFIDTTSLQ